LPEQRQQPPGGYKPDRKWKMILLSMLGLVLVGFLVRKPAPVAEGVILPGKGALLFLSMVIVAGGLLFWWGIEKVFWRKYFPTQDTPRPIDRPRGKTGGSRDHDAG